MQVAPWYTLSLTFSLGLGAPASPWQQGLVSKTANMAFALIHCHAETDTDQDYEDCKKCFDGISDFNSETGLQDAKLCVENYFPIAKEDCGSELSLLVLGDVHSSMSTLTCFQQSLQRRQAKQCLLNTSTEQEELSSFVTAEICMLEKSEEIGKLLLIDVYENKVDDNEGVTNNNDNIGSVLVSAHCEMTNEASKDRLECEQCVLATIVDVLMANTTKEINAGLNNLKQCSLEFLSEEHDECIDTALESVGQPTFGLQTAMYKLKDCGTRIMVRNVVKSCLEVVEDSDADDLDVMEKFLQVDTCSQVTAATWINVRGGNGELYVEEEVQGVDGNDV